MADGCHTEAPMRFLVTGATRVVGSHLARPLVDVTAIWVTA